MTPWHRRSRRTRKTGARWTDDYLNHQVIPYLGNKRRLLGLIEAGISRTGIKQGTFADLFAGSGVVSRLAKKLGFSVFANDWEPYTFELGSAYVALDGPPPFEALGGMEGAFAALNALPGVRCPEPLGAFYVFPDFSAAYERVGVAGSMEFCEKLLLEGKVVCVPGKPFGEDRCIRLSYATSMEKIQEGIRRINEFLK